MSNTTRYGISALGLQYKDQAQNDEILIDQETGQIHYKRPDGKIVTSSGGGVGGAVPEGVIGTNDILRTVTTESISNILKEGVEKNPSLSEHVRLSLNNLEGTKKEVITYKVTLTTPKTVNHISNGEVTYRFNDVEKLLLDDESLLVIEPIFDKGVKLADLLKSGGNYYNYQIKFSFNNYSVNNMNNVVVASLSRNAMVRNNILIYSLDKRKLNDITFNKTDSELILNNVDLVKANSVSSKLTGLNINDLKIHGFLIYLINIDPYRSGRPINEFNNSPDTDNLKLLMRENAYEIFKNDIIEMKSKEIKHIENIQSSQDFINYLSSLGGSDVKNHLIYLYDGMGDLFSRMSTYLSRSNLYSVDMRFYTDGTGYQTSYSTKRNGRYNVYITYDGELKKVYFYLNSADVSGVTAGEDSLKLNTDNDKPVEFKTNDGRIVTLQEVFQSASEGKRKIADILTGLGIPTDTEADWSSIEKSMKQNVMNKSDDTLNKIHTEGFPIIENTVNMFKIYENMEIGINSSTNVEAWRLIKRSGRAWIYNSNNRLEGDYSCDYVITSDNRNYSIFKQNGKYFILFSIKYSNSASSYYGYDNDTYLTYSAFFSELSSDFKTLKNPKLVYDGNYKRAIKGIGCRQDGENIYLIISYMKDRSTKAYDIFRYTIRNNDMVMQERLTEVENIVITDADFSTEPSYRNDLYEYEVNLNNRVFINLKTKNIMNFGDLYLDINTNSVYKNNMKNRSLYQNIPVRIGEKHILYFVFSSGENNEGNCIFVYESKNNIWSNGGNYIFVEKGIPLSSSNRNISSYNTYIPEKYIYIGEKNSEFLYIYDIKNKILNKFKDFHKSFRYIRRNRDYKSNNYVTNLSFSNIVPFRDNENLVHISISDHLYLDNYYINRFTFYNDGENSYISAPYNSYLYDYFLRYMKLSKDFKLEYMNLSTIFSTYIHYNYNFYNGFHYSSDNVGITFLENTRDFYFKGKNFNVLKI